MKSFKQLVGLILIALIIGGCGSSSGPNIINNYPDGLVVVDIIPGTGRAAQAGDTLKVHYTGRLQSTGEIFDSSTGGNPFTFSLGTGSVIRGWDIGLVGMKEGGRRQLTIAPQYAYGENGSPPRIPPNATLVFVVDLIEVN